MAFLAEAGGLVGSKLAWAEANLQVGGGSPQAHLDFRLSVPTILYLQVGTTGATIDRITFAINNIPGTGDAASPPPSSSSVVNILISLVFPTYGTDRVYVTDPE